MMEVKLHDAAVYLQWIYERRGLKMLTKAARQDFTFYVEQARKLDALPTVDVFDLLARDRKQSP